MTVYSAVWVIHRVIENILPKRSLFCPLSVNVTGLLIDMHPCAFIMGLAHCSGSQAGVLQAQGDLIIAAGGFNQVFLIENKQMISLYSTGINRSLIHEFPNYTAPFWKSVGIQTQCYSVYNFLLLDRSIV